MKVQAKAGATFARLDDDNAGEGLAIFFSQSEGDTVRWRFDVYAKVDNGAELLVGWFYVSPPSATSPIGPCTRQVGAAVCPGATTWSVCVSPALGSEVAANESANITLASSKCCTAPVGVTRVGERYVYHSGTTPGGGIAVGMFPGMKITGVAAIGLAGGGSFHLGFGQTVYVPEGVGASLSPQALAQFIPISSSVTFTNVNYILELLESG